MRTAILSVFFVVISSAAPQQDPPKPASGHQPSQQKPAEQPLTVLCARGDHHPTGCGVQLAGDRFGRQRCVSVCHHRRRPAGRHRAESGHRRDQRHAYRRRHFLLHSSGDRLERRDRHHGQHAVYAATAGGACRARRPRVPIQLQASGGSAPALRSRQSCAADARSEIDPAKLAAPRDKATAKAAQAVGQDDHPFILGAEDQISVMIYGSPEFSGAAHDPSRRQDHGALPRRRCGRRLQPPGTQQYHQGTAEEVHRGSGCQRFGDRRSTASATTYRARSGVPADSRCWCPPRFWRRW